MGTPRKLTQESERQVALAYLCRIDTDYISNTWDISDATIRGSIVGRRSKEWGDPLVEFYRQTPPSNRLRNAAHLYLVFQNREVPQGDLVDRTTDSNIYRLVDRSIFGPEIFNILDNTCLEKFLKEKEPHEILLRAIFGYMHADEVVAPIYVDKIYEEYLGNVKFSLKRVVDEASKAVICGIRQGHLAISPKKAEVIHEVLGTLGDREQYVLSLLYGLTDKEVHTHEQVAELLRVTRERVRQIEAKAILKLQFRGRSRNLEFLIGLVSDADVEREYWHRKLYPVIEQEVIQKARHDPALWRELEQARDEFLHRYSSTKIRDLELTVRARNCLHSDGIETVAQLAQKTEEELLEICHFGETSLIEVEELLFTMGLELRRS